MSCVPASLRRASTTRRAIRPIYHQTDERIEAHIFVAFLAYCLQVTLKQRLRSLAPGLTPRSVLEKMAAIQMVDVQLPTTDGRTVILSRYTEPEVDQAVLLQQLKISLPAQPPPRVIAPDVPARYDRPHCGADLPPTMQNQRSGGFLPSSSESRVSRSVHSSRKAVEQKSTLRTKFAWRRRRPIARVAASRPVAPDDASRGFPGGHQHATICRQRHRCENQFQAAVKRLRARPA